MKIAIVTGRFPIIGEAFILDQITKLIDRGHDITIIAGSDPKETIAHEKVKRYRLLEITYYTKPPKNKIKRISQACRIILTYWHEHANLLLKVLNVFRYGRRALSLSLLFYLEPFLKRKFDLIHVHFGPQAMFYLFIKDLIDVPYVATFHGYDYSKVLSSFQGKDYRGLFRNADVITASSNYALNKIQELGCDARKLIKTPYGIEVDNITLRLRYLQPSEELRILTVARLTEKKGIPIAVQAIAKLSSKYRLRYDIVGATPEPLKTHIRELIHKLNLDSNVTLHGPKTREELKKIYDDAHLFLMASHTSSDGDEESQGVVLLEAQAAGLPIVATLHNGFPESIAVGQSGYLVCEKDVDALAVGLERVIQEQDRWPKMGKAGREFVKQNFDIDNAILNLEAAFEKARTEKWGSLRESASPRIFTTAKMLTESGTWQAPSASNTE